MLSYLLKRIIHVFLVFQNTALHNNYVIIEYIIVVLVCVSMKKTLRSADYEEFDVAAQYQHFNIDCESCDLVLEKQVDLVWIELNGGV